MDENLNFDTLAVRAGTLRSDFNEHSEAIFLTSSFVFASAAHAAESFKNSEEAYTYSRFTNPTVAMLSPRSPGCTSNPDDRSASNSSLGMRCTCRRLGASGFRLAR